jgi:hypothetical protein
MDGALDHVLGAADRNVGLADALTATIVKGIASMRVLNFITLLLVIVGGLNWGLVGLFDFDLVRAIFGHGAAATADVSAASRIVYILVALSAIYQIAPLARVMSDRRDVAYH